MHYLINKKMHGYLFTVIFILFSFIISGCQKKPEQSITVGTNIWAGYEPAYIASALNLYGNADIHMRQFPSATEVLRAFRNDTIDVAALTLDEALLLKQRGMAIKIIMVADISNGADAILTRPQFNNLRDLAGKNIGVEDSALGAYVLARATQIHHIEADSFQQINITADEAVSTYKSGKVDAVVAFEPFRSQLIALGAREIFTSKEIPNEIIDVLVVRQEFARNNPVVIKKLIEGWQKAVDVLNNDQETAYKIIGARQNLSLDQVRESYEGLKIPTIKENYALLGKNGGIAQSSKKLIPFLEGRNGIEMKLDIGDVVTSEFLPVPQDD